MYLLKQFHQVVKELDNDMKAAGDDFDIADIVAFLSREADTALSLPEEAPEEELPCNEPPTPPRR